MANRQAASPTPYHKELANFITAQSGEKITPKAVWLTLTHVAAFRNTPENAAAREVSRKLRNSRKAELAARRQERVEARASKLEAKAAEIRAKLNPPAPAPGDEPIEVSHVAEVPSEDVVVAPAPESTHPWGEDDF